MALPSTWAQFLAAIRAQETGGNYSQDTAGALGAYSWNDQSSWDTMATAAGEKHWVGVNPSQVPPSVQDKVASFNLARIYQQAGGGTNGYRAAAMWWNGGSTKSVANRGLPAQPWAKSCGGGSSAAYACQVLTRMGLGGHFLAGPGSGAGGVVTTAAAATADCALGFPNLNPIPSWVPVLGTSTGGCVLTKSQVRAVYGAALLGAGAILMLVGLAFVGVLAGPGRRVIGMIPDAGLVKAPSAEQQRRAERTAQREEMAQIPRRTDLRSSQATP